jgi:hypothetical protein
MKVSTLSPAKLQCAKYVHRVHQDYNDKSYDEKIFYDTLKLPDQYYTEQKFIDMFLSKLSVNCKPITINHGNLNRQNVQVQVSENIIIEIEVEININQRIVEHNDSLYIQVPNNMNMKLEYYTNIKTTSIDRISYNNIRLISDYFKIGDWTIYISDILVTLYRERESTFRSSINISFIYNKTKPNNLLMIHELESVIIQNALEQAPDPNIIIFNMYMTPINRQLLNSVDLPQIPVELKVLFSMQNISSFEIFHMFKTHPDLMSRIELFKELFKREYNFTVDNAPAAENRQQFRPNIYEDWEQLFNIPRITKDTYGIKEKMLEFFCNKYSEMYPNEGIVCKSSTLLPVASVVLPFAASSTPQIALSVLSPQPQFISPQQLSAESTSLFVSSAESSNALSSQIPPTSSTKLPTILSQTSTTPLASFQKSPTQSGLSAPLSPIQVTSSTSSAVEQSAPLSAALFSNIGRKYKIVGIRIINTTDPNKYEFEGKIVYL